METTSVKKMSVDLGYIRSIIQELVDEEFPGRNNIAKREIIERSDEFAFAAPCCGDSMKNYNKKRGTVYYNSLKYVCYNCGYRGSILSLMKMKNKTIDLSKKMDIVEYVKQSYEQNTFKHQDFDMSELKYLVEYDEIRNNSHLFKLYDISDIQPGSVVHKYLSKRKISENQYINIKQAKYRITDKWTEDVMISFNMSRNKVLGFQIRNLNDDRNKRIYKIFSHSEIMETIYPDLEMDEIEKIGYNKLSYLYNILNIDWNKYVTVFEGYIDSLFFQNSIGCVGTNTDTSLIKNIDCDLRFFYDYDKTGIKKAKEIIDSYPVFLWELFFESWSKKTKDPFKNLMLMRSTIVDLNDVVKKTSKYRELDIEKFFSRDSFDKMYIKDISN
jgi:predicted RNA-binding Zn-ribbon protein involved in translation (DUF1610 family)